MKRSSYECKEGGEQKLLELIRIDAINNMELNYSLDASDVLNILKVYYGIEVPKEDTAKIASAYKMKRGQIKNLCESTMMRIKKTVGEAVWYNELVTRRNSGFHPSYYSSNSSRGINGKRKV